MLQLWVLDPVCILRIRQMSSDDLDGVWQELGQLRAAVSVPRESPRTAKQFSAGAGDSAEGDLIRAFRAAETQQLRFVFDEVHM